MNKLKIAIVLAAFASAVSAAPLAEKHKNFGLSDEPAQAQCEMCHGNLAAVADKTKDVVPNPHRNHMGRLPCSACHSWKQQSRYICNDCHSFPEQQKNLNK